MQQSGILCINCQNEELIHYFNFWINMSLSKYEEQSNYWEGILYVDGTVVQQMYRF